MLNTSFSLAFVGSDKQKSDSSIMRALALAKEKHGWNQTAFATAMDVSPGHVTNWKTRGLPNDQLETAANALGCSVDYLLGREVRPKSGANVVSISQPWPFTISRKRYDDLSYDDKIRLDERVKSAVEELEANRGKRKLRS
jgi:hypothetical protein